jgi:anti-sigma B factor antagonist
MDTNDVAMPCHAAVDTARSQASGRPRPDSTAGMRPDLGECAGQSVPVLRGVRPEPSPWVVVSEVTVAGADRVVVALVGEIDIANAGYLRAELAYLIDAGHVDIVADLSRTVSISSSGLGVLVGARKTVRRLGGRLQLVASQESLLRILRITRLTRVFTIHPTVEDALGT